MKESISPEIRQYMSALGRSKSEAKRQAAIANGATSQFKPKALAEIACNCGGEGLEHKSTCPRGRAIRYRQKKGLPMV